MRDETEWTELVDGGHNVVVGADYDAILSAENNLTAMNNDYSNKLYGNGNAGEQIIQSIIKHIM